MDNKRYCKATLLDRDIFSEDLAVFRVEPDEQLSFTPGQFATLALEDENGRPLRRPYSVASAPHEPFLEVFVERVDGGDFTPYLWHMDPGQTLWVRKRIAGIFVLDDESGRQKHIMAGTVTGATPYVSMVRDQLHALEEGTLDTPMEMLVIHGASRSWELGTYLDEMRRLDEQADWLTYVPTISRPWEDPQWTGEVGRVEDVLRKYMDDAGFTSQNAVAYACGHPKMIEKVRDILARANFAEDYFNEEKYFVERNT